MKKCSKCKEEKEVIFFNKNNKADDGLYSWCKRCTTDNARTYYINNKQKLLEEDRKEYNTIDGRYRFYKSSAKTKNLQFTLSKEDFHIILSKKCYYCGAQDLIKGIGIDRIDSSAGYILNNCRSCCSMCNYMKNEYSEQDFLAQIEKIAENLKL